MLKTILIFVHLGSFALSFGLVLFCDIMMMSIPFKGNVTPRQLDFITAASAAIYKALVVLIVSGLLFLPYYYFYSAESLLNPKLYVKMLVVAILSVNGYWLHKKGIEVLKIGLTEDLRTKANVPLLKKLLTSGGLSAISWWTAFLLGTFKELNFKYSFLEMTSLYFILIAGMILSIEFFIKVVNGSIIMHRLGRIWN